MADPRHRPGPTGAIPAPQARAYHVDFVAGTFAGIALALNALVSAILAPIVLRAFL
ncbi:hypothetical protein [Roseomonas xinghualingensis]|uniref:hypothetical protein n=1 Tax=Roseomonas xinghualingensis TaxID=2986475 RepID=UPI0021F11CCB|nr:hypothetical protein [Roseomonas sp. SXEYE001]MCV4208254.1 hypothetical protein [Roseomonas sp. SXEYE001]